MEPIRDTTPLVRAAAAGDHAAWAALVDEFASSVWSIARGYRLNAADAADVSRVTWLRLVDYLDRMVHPDQVASWLTTTALRESRRMLRLTVTASS
jgi:DNA-directed RNA polymerase specialized sigma24 family protein